MPSLLINATAPPYNCVADGVTDCLAGLQNAINDAASLGGGDVALIGAGPAGFAMSGPIQMRTGVRLLGLGNARITTFGGYCGPGITVGLPGVSGQFDATYRPLSDSVYDASALLPTGTHRYGIATKGLAALVVTSHPVQFGYTDINKQPDYYKGVGKLCIDLFIERPAGATWPNGAAICGSGDSFGNPGPWAVRATTDGFWLDLKGDEAAYRIAGGYHRLHAAADMSGTTQYRLIFQVDTAADKAQCSVNGGTMTDMGRVANFPAAGQESIANLSLLQSDGIRPFMIAYLNDLMDARSGFTNLNLYGLQVNRGLKYAWGAVPTLTASPLLPVTDAIRYFTNSPVTLPANSYIASLPLTDPGAGNPWAEISSAFGTGLLFWSPPVDNQNSPTDVAIEGLEILSPVQPAVLMGQHLTLRITRVKAESGCQAFGSLPLRNSYVVYIAECDIEGTDAALASYSQIGEMRAVQVGGAGRQALRFSLGEWVIDGVKVNGSQPWTETVITIVGGGDGAGYDVRNVFVDNETNGLGRAAVLIDSGQGGLGHYTISGFKVVTTPVMVELAGAGLARCVASRVDVHDLYAFNPVTTALHVVGPQQFFGTVDASTLKAAVKVVDVAGADAAITYTGPSSLL